MPAAAAPIHRKTDMTPRDQIQEHAKIAASKIREAMTEFAEATGMRAGIDIDWMQAHCLEEDAPTNRVAAVRIRIGDEAMG